MVSFIIVSKNPSKGLEYINEQCDTLDISPFDRVILSKDSQEKATTQSIGIAEIKLLQKKIYLKPMQGNDKAVIIQDGEIITNEAQNALLKVLEEPPAHTYIYILTESLSALLPTIISRCKVMQIEQETVNKTTETTTAFLLQLPRLAIGDKLHIAEVQGKQKQIAIEWLEQLLSDTRSLLANLVEEKRGDHLQFYIHLAKNIQQTRDTIQSTNVNVRLALEHLLLTS